MNYLKKKLKPITTSLTSANNPNFSRTKKDKNSNKTDLEDDLYDDYIVEAPPHPSELIALGIDPSEIDANDPEKLKELYQKAKLDGKSSQTNSVLLAKQRQKLEIEEKKKTKEEWKFFDSITARVEKVVKQSQQTLDQLKETSAVDKLQEPEYDLRLSADEVFKSSGSSQKIICQDKNSGWINFEEDDSKSAHKSTADDNNNNNCNSNNTETATDAAFAYANRKDIVEELLEDFGLDLRSPEEQKKHAERLKEATVKQQEIAKKIPESELQKKQPSVAEVKAIDLKKAVRPRPRPKKQEVEDPFDTSFVQAPTADDDVLQSIAADADQAEEQLTNKIEEAKKPEPKPIDPFDTSYIQL